MDDIARLSGVSKKTVYQEFVDKNQLVFESFQAALEVDEKKIQQLPQMNDGIIDHLIGLSNYIRKRFTDINPLVLNEIQRYYPQCWQLFEDFKTKRLYKDIVDLLEKGVDDGYFRPEIDTEIIALLRLEQMVSLMDPIKFPPSKYKMGDLHLEIFEHFLYGIFTEKGKQTYLKKKSKQE